MAPVPEGMGQRLASFSWNSLISNQKEVPNNYSRAEQSIDW